MNIILECNSIMDLGKTVVYSDKRYVDSSFCL